MRAMVGWLFSFVVVVVVVARAHRARQRVTYARDANADPRNTKKKPPRCGATVRCVELARCARVGVTCASPVLSTDRRRRRRRRRRTAHRASRIADGVTDDDDDDGSTAQATRPAVMATDRV